MDIRLHPQTLYLQTPNQSKNIAAFVSIDNKAYLALDSQIPRAKATGPQDEILTTFLPVERPARITKGSVITVSHCLNAEGLAYSVHTSMRGSYPLEVARTDTQSFAEALQQNNPFRDMEAKFVDIAAQLHERGLSEDVRFEPFLDKKG